MKEIPGAVAGGAPFLAARPGRPPPWLRSAGSERFRPVLLMQRRSKDPPPEAGRAAARALRTVGDDRLLEDFLFPTFLSYAKNPETVNGKMGSVKKSDTVSHCGEIACPSAKGVLSGFRRQGYSSLEFRYFFEFHSSIGGPFFPPGPRWMTPGNGGNLPPGTTRDRGPGRGLDSRAGPGLGPGMDLAKTAVLGYDAGPLGLKRVLGAGR
jgi:hypothetical protein